MSWYPLIKHVHMTAVALSLGLFLLRGAWMITESPRLQRRWVKILPHAVDTVLLVAGLALAFMLGLYPFGNAPWLTAKVLALLLYIGLGMMALKRGRTKTVRITAWLVAIVVFVYIVRTAMLRSPWPW